MTNFNQSMRKSINHLQRKAPQMMKRFMAILLVILVVGQLVPVQADVLGEHARKFFDSSLKPILMPSSGVRQSKKPSPPQNIETPSERLARVSSIRLCPRRLKLYVGESFTLSPLALDSNQKTVHGTNPSWQSASPAVASVDSTGEVLALSAGSATLTVTLGKVTASVSVEVVSGLRPFKTEAEGDEEHKDDCNNPVSSSLPSSSNKMLAAVGINDDTDKEQENLKTRLKNAVLRVKEPLAEQQKAIKVASLSQPTPAAVGGVFFNVPPPDGESGDLPSTNATAPYNAIGSPPHFPTEAMGEGPTKMERNLGSDNYSFTAPIVSLGGRGIGVDLAMTYNSRLWNKEDTEMRFNYNKGWPAAGWTLGYGRLIPNYDGSSEGNYLLIQPDGTRIRLERVPNTNICESKDGSFIQLNTNNRNLLYPDGTRVNYISFNERYLPNDIRTSNGNKIVITYKQFNKSVPSTDPLYFPFRWAIEKITDSLGREIRFHYYGDSGYPENAVNGKPKYALAAVTTPDLSTGNDKVVIKLDYDAVTIATNFSLPTVGAPTTLTVVRRIIYPETGRGYLFENFSSYGMAKKISARKDMRGANNTFTDGTAVSYTEYNYQDTGSLDDSPGYIDRKEWWLDKTNAAGVADNTPTVYLYNRNRTDGTIEITYPGSIMKVKTFTDNEPVSNIYGVTTKTETRDGDNTLLQKTEYTYVFLSGGGLRIQRLDTTNEAGEKSTIGYVYGSYGRVEEINEYGFSPTILRKTTFDYMNDAQYIDRRMLRLVKWTRVYQGSSQLVAQSRNFYDEYENSSYPGPGGSGLKTYTPSQTVPNHVASFDDTFYPRGNITRVNHYTDVTADFIENWIKYDIFGNTVEATVSCCNLKQAAFSQTHWFSQPDSTTDGNAAASPHLTTSYQYDFHTGLVKQVTAPNGTFVTYDYDTALRLEKVTSPTLATNVTNVDKDSLGNDQLSYFQRVTYNDAVEKKITSRSWFDGAGHVLRAGTGEYTNPTSYDMTKVIYDHLGRVTKQSNPYAGDQDGIGTPSHFTVNTYDTLSRVKQITLPDSQTVMTDYSGSQMTTTDQVGRKRRNLLDGLGRLVRVDEQDATGSLGTVAAPTQSTSYTYDALDNLTQVSQGLQLRKYKYDALSRLLFEKTPEQSATINDGSGTFWSAKYEYTLSGKLLKHTDARQVETHHQYDALNRLTKMWYTGIGGNDSGTIRPSLPVGIETTAETTLSYKLSGTGIGQLDTVTNGAITEAFSYDSMGRPASVNRSFPGNSNTYTTNYDEYNTINQLKSLTYPSGKKLKTIYDNRGRLDQIDRYNSSNNLQATYLSAMHYNVAGQVEHYTLGNGVYEDFNYSATRLQLTSQTATKGTTTILSLSYNYQAAAEASGAGTSAGNSGQLMSVTGTVNGQGRNQSFTYDNLGRLKTAAGWNSSTNRRFAYDRHGNRTGVWDVATPTGGNPIQPVSLEQSGGAPTNRLISVNGVNYNYDANGNVTHDGAHAYKYDAENRLVQVDAGTSGIYQYDTANRRVKKQAGGFTTYCIWEGGSLIAEYSNAPASGSGVKYYHSDRLSTRAITSGSPNMLGNVLGTQDHLPFGEDAGVWQESEKHRFTNYERDIESETDYAVNRQYSNSTGRFLRPDPVDGSPGNPQSFNRYTYAVNDPINLTDPLGLNFCPPNFTSCGAVRTYVPGLGVREIQVGYNDGYGTFLWGQSLSRLDSEKIPEWARPLPHGFLIYPNLTLKGFHGLTLDMASASTSKKIEKELKACEDQASQGFAKWFETDFNASYYKQKRRDQLEEELKSAIGAGFGIQAAQAFGTGKWRDGVQESMEMISLAFAKRISVIALFTPFVHLNRALNVSGSTLEEFIEDPTAQAVYESNRTRFNQQRKQCQKKVRKKYGL
jgi:RHS repeat-associated protein